jgi:DNA-binding transcriptional regulator/RsmH inhibitor MraZ
MKHRSLWDKQTYFCDIQSQKAHDKTEFNKRILAFLLKKNYNMRAICNVDEKKRIEVPRTVSFLA